MTISGSVIFRAEWWGCHFNLLYNIEGGLEKCHVVLHRVGWQSESTIFALYNMQTAPNASVRRSSCSDDIEH